ncbi:MAG: hypothetical protein KUL75_07170 [Sterolibacterium sp.]|nr:hypothetical protein [Sterolibacterium sp.]
MITLICCLAVICAMVALHSAAAARRLLPLTVVNIFTLIRQQAQQGEPGCAVPTLPPATVKLPQQVSAKKQGDNAIVVALGQ